MAAESGRHGPASKDVDRWFWSTFLARIKDVHVSFTSINFRISDKKRKFFFHIFIQTLQYGIRRCTRRSVQITFPLGWKIRKGGQKLRRTEWIPHSSTATCSGPNDLNFRWIWNPSDYRESAGQGWQHRETGEIFVRAGPSTCALLTRVARSRILGRIQSKSASEFPVFRTSQFRMLFGQVWMIDWIPSQSCLLKNASALLRWCW